MFEELRQHQFEKFGYVPKRVFEGAPPLELIEHWTIEAMKKGDVEPTLIYAYEKTNGLLVNSKNEYMMPDSDIAEWEAAIDEYERTTGKTALRRRLNDRDLEAMLENGPKERRTAEFVTKLPFPPPFAKERWKHGSLSFIIEDPQCRDYFMRCLDDIEESGRAENYVRMFSMMAALPERRGQEIDYQKLAEEALDRNFTPAEFNVALESGGFGNCGHQIPSSGVM